MTSRERCETLTPYLELLCTTVAQ